jgi:DNA-binding NtrC family response regulator
VIADGTAAITHPPEYWSDETEGPVRRAQGGTLVVLNAAALPVAAQNALARALWQRSAPSDAATPPAVLFATLPAGPQALLEARALSLTLAQYLLPQRLALPALCERPEDLRGLILDRLLRAGGRAFAQPLGIEPSALAQLVEYAWPGNDAELHGVIDRAARRAKGERVMLQDLMSSGLPQLREVVLGSREPELGVVRRDVPPAPERSGDALGSEPPSTEDRTAPVVSGVVEAPSPDLEIARPPSEPAPERRVGSERRLRGAKAAERASEEEAGVRSSPRRRRRR